MHERLVQRQLVCIAGRRSFGPSIDATPVFDIRKTLLPDMIGCASRGRGRSWRCMSNVNFVAQLLTSGATGE